jgi:hypothetical protein
MTLITRDDDFDGDKTCRDVDADVRSECVGSRTIRFVFDAREANVFNGKNSNYPTPSHGPALTTAATGIGPT